MEEVYGKSVFAPALRAPNRRLHAHFFGGESNQPKSPRQICQNGSPKPNQTNDLESFETESLSEIGVRPPLPFKMRPGVDSYDIKDTFIPKDTAVDSFSPQLEELVSAAINQRQTITSIAEGMEFLIADGGVKKRILLEGEFAEDGESLEEIPDGYQVWLHYETFYQDHETGLFMKLDSTKSHGLATSMKLGESSFTGMYLALKSMRRREIAEFLIEPEYAYGRMGIPGFIKPNTRVRAFIELADVVENPLLPVEHMNPLEDDFAQLSFTDFVEVVEKLLHAGKQKVESGFYRDAIERYTRALEILDNYLPTEDDLDEILEMKRFQLYANLALCHIREERYKDAIEKCKAALHLVYQDIELKPKVLFRYATACFHLKNFEGTLKLCDRGLRCSWGREAFTNLKCKVDVALLEKRLKNGTDAEKAKLAQPKPKSSEEP